MENEYPTKEQFDNMSENQKKFVKAAKKKGLNLRSYSGRCMYGRTCPAAVVVSPYDYFKPRCRVSQDNMGLDMVIYASE